MDLPCSVFSPFIHPFILARLHTQLNEQRRRQTERHQPHGEVCQLTAGMKRWGNRRDRARNPKRRDSRPWNRQPITAGELFTTRPSETVSVWQEFRRSVAEAAAVCFPSGRRVVPRQFLHEFEKVKKVWRRVASPLIKIGSSQMSANQRNAEKLIRMIIFRGASEPRHLRFLSNYLASLPVRPSIRPSVRLSSRRPAYFSVCRRILRELCSMFAESIRYLNKIFPSVKMDPVRRLRDRLASAA